MYCVPFGSETLSPSSGLIERDSESTSDRRAQSSSNEEMNYTETRPTIQDGEFGRVDPTGWYPYYKLCLKQFLEVSQYTPTVQSVATFLNIRLPFQNPLGNGATAPEAAPYVSLRPYVRRLIVTAQDSPMIMEAFFGNDWEAGVGCIYKQERSNYLFTAKSGGWASTKAAYDVLPDEPVPFLRPLREPSEEEVCIAEARWSEWLAMEDWMVGARSPW